MNRELFERLCTLDGVSGREQAVRAFLLERLQESPAPKEVTVDSMGNILVHLIGQKPAKQKVLFDAHMDEVGFIITHITDEGLLRFASVGGIEKAVLFGHRVRIGAQSGVIGGKAMHQCHGDEDKNVPDIQDMYIDIGASTKQEAEALGNVGQTGTFDAGLTWINDTHFCGKAADDRVGCLLLLELAQTQPVYDVWLCFSVQEELGLRGAGAAAEAIAPDIAIAVEATTAADSAGSTSASAVCCVGQGAVVSFADAATLYDADLYALIRARADAARIPTQTKNKICGGNNAGAIQRRGTGARMAAVSLPCRYLHSPACLGCVTDVEAMGRLLQLLCAELAQ